MGEPEPMRRVRSLAGTLSALLLAGVLAGSAQAASNSVPKRIVFPVVGHAHYQNDFGDPRYSGSHQGNDILADWRAPVVAAEAGTVRIYKGSASAGCMLYLYGKSGTTYLYIHLNNDRTRRNDNKGRCKPGVAYAPGLSSGQKVRAGELLGYNGNSGDANWAPYHLHFELWPRGKRPVSPYKYLRRAYRLLFAAPEPELRAASGAATITLVGKVRSVEPPASPVEGAATEADADIEPVPGRLVLRTTRASLSVGGTWRVTRKVTLALPPDAVVERGAATKRRLAIEDIAPGTKVTVTTAPAPLSLKTQRARPGALTAALIVLRR